MPSISLSPQTLERLATALEANSRPVAPRLAVSATPPTPPNRSLCLVLGPESSGTRLLTKILLHGGCTGDDTHSQRWDKSSWGDTQHVAWRRSVPHDGQPLALRTLLERVESERRVTVLVTTRDITACADSQVRTGHAANHAEAHLKIESAYSQIFRQLYKAAPEIPFYVVSYESLVLHPAATQKALWGLLSLPDGVPVEVTDENYKHYNDTLKERCESRGEEYRK